MIQEQPLPKTLIIDLSHRFGGGSERGLGLLQALPPGSAALAALAGRPVYERAQSLGLEVYPVGHSKTDPRIAWRLIRLIREGKFQVLDTQNPQSKFWGSIASAWTGAALVSTLNSWPLDEHLGGNRGKAYYFLERATAGLTDLFIAVSSEIRGRLQAIGVPDEAIAMIPNAVEINPDPIPGDGAWLRDTFNLPNGSRICCAVGRLVEAKGYPHLIAAMERLRHRLPRLYCLIVGSGHLHEVLAEQIARSGLQERVRLLGFRDHDQALAILKASDFFVMPSLTEGTPVALLEAAALARPVVASRVGGIPDLVTEPHTALLTPPGDEIALADAMAWICEHPAEAASMGENAREMALVKFNRQTQIAALKQAYARALGQARDR
jgi:glycosyltransferase involved in cell wall biosynthesis